MSDFKQEIINKLKSKTLDNGKPKLTESSINLYLKNIERLNDDLPLKSIKDLVILLDIEKIKEKLSNYKPNTQRQYYVSIINVLDVVKSPKNKFNKLYDDYHNVMINKAKEIDEIPSDQMNDNQKNNWISWEEVEKVYDDYKIKINKFIKNKELSEKQYNDLLSLFILSLYINNPPRRNQDYMIMNIVKEKEMTEDKKFNYLVFDNDLFIFNKFKTSKSFETQEFKFNDEQKQILKIFIKYHPILKNKITKTTNIPLLVYYDGKPFEKVNSITRVLNKIFMKSTKKRIGSSLLRHIFITDKLGPQIKEQQELADKMGHSVGTQKDYIKDIEV